jgi:peptidyl-prolyl cis-trans isomerase D
LLFSEDKVSIAILDINNIKIKISNEEIKQYWQQNKEKYKTNKGFKIAYVDIENIKSKNKQEMKKVALREYLKLKKNKSNFTKEIVLYENSDFLPPQELSKIFVATQNKVLKPIYNKDHYIVVKLISTIKPKALPYQEAKQMAKDDLIASKKEQIINQKINNMIQNFTGTDIGYISKYKTPTIKGLTKDEVSNVVKSIFNSQKSIDKIKFNDKVVVYKITDSRFVKYNKDKDGIILETMSDLKSNLVFANLLKQLQTRYAIQSFMESK